MIIQNGGSYQFRDIRKGEEYLEITLDNGEKLEARLFPETSKNAVNELKKAESTKIFNNFKMSLGDLGELIPIFKNGQIQNSTFTSGHTDEINLNLVPYKGAILVEEYADRFRKSIWRIFKNNWRYYRRFK